MFFPTFFLSLFYTQTLSHTHTHTHIHTHTQSLVYAWDMMLGNDYTLYRPSTLTGQLQHTRTRTRTHTHSCNTFSTVLTTSCLHILYLNLHFSLQNRLIYSLLSVNKKLCFCIKRSAYREIAGILFVAAKVVCATLNCFFFTLALRSRLLSLVTIPLTLFFSLSLSAFFYLSLF